MQLFFIISGFLNKKVPFDLFLKKLSKQLIIPMLLLGFIVILINNSRLLVNHEFTVLNLFDNIIGLLAGEQFILGSLWFVYTLIIVKIISQISFSIYKLIIAVICLICATIYNEYGNHLIQNCWMNTLLAYPMFYLGELLSTYKQKISQITNRATLIVLFFIGITGVIITGIYNGPVWMYRCLYGNNIILYLLGGCSGAIMVFSISKLLLDKPNDAIKLISEGSILILAFHIQFVNIGLHFPIGYGYYLESVLIILIFIPVIKLCQKRFPILMGYRGAKEIRQSHVTI